MKSQIENHTHTQHTSRARFYKKCLKYNEQDTVLNNAVAKKSSGPQHVRWPHPENICKRDRSRPPSPDLKEWLVAHGLDAGAMIVRALRTGGHVVQRRQRLPRLEHGRHNRVRVRVVAVVVVRDMHVRRRHVNGLWRRLVVIVVMVVVVVVVVVAAVIDRRVRRTSRVLVVVTIVAVICLRALSRGVRRASGGVRRASRSVRRAGGRRRRHRVARPLGIAHDLKVVARLPTVARHVPERTARTLVGRRGLADTGRLFRPTLRAGAARGRRGGPARR